MKKIIFFFSISLIIIVAANAQNVGIGTTTPNATAQLDISSTNKGLLIPRMTSVQRFAIVSPAAGLMVYETTSNNFWFYNGTAWAQVGATGVSSTWATNGNDIYNNNSGNVGIGTTTPQAAFTVAANKTVLFGSDTLNAGTKMMWLPAKSAFRVGTVDGVNWNPDSIGNWSFASGYATKAKGIGSTAMGGFTTASGDNSTAMGIFTTASGDYSTAMGNETIASKQASTAIGYRTTASGSSSTALGYLSNATEFATTAMGLRTIASGEASTAMGNLTAAAGAGSTAMGNRTLASGDYATATGIATNAKSFGSTAIGQFNDTIAGSNTTSFIPTDPLFYIGNGSHSLAVHNAMVVYKNGNMILKNPTRVNAIPASFTVPISGAGTRMMWLPEKGAFRVGTVGITSGSGVNWNADSIGLWSFASGIDTKAKGDGSTAMGNRTHATGFISTAMGFGTIASGYTSTAMGERTTASGFLSTAMGWRTTASGFFSTSMGNGTTASGNISTAIGAGTVSKAYSSLSIGSFNDSIISSNNEFWVTTDPLLIIGNGTFAVRSNAMVVYKNGNTDINGYTRLGEVAEAAPKIKMKKIIIPAGPAVNANANYPFGGGITDSKVLGIDVLLRYDASTSKIPPGYTDAPGYEYNVQVQFNGVTVINKVGNSGNIGGKPITVVITYEE